MDKILEQSLLYDFYGELLTSHQKDIYEDFVLNDLSLGEVAQVHEISRQAVHDIIRRCNRQLAGYEEKLHLVERFLDTKKKAEEILNCARNMEGLAPENSELMQAVEKIEKISAQILDNL